MANSLLLWFLLAGSVANSCFLAWQLLTSRSENRDLRLQNERLIARLAVEYHFAASRPGEPPTIPDVPASAPMFRFRSQR